MPKILSDKEIEQEVKRQWTLISRGTVDLLPEKEWKDKLKESIAENKPLRVKQGFDPTAPDIHLGHTVGIRKLKQFQELGHQIVLIIGDYTSLVGDPSGQSSTRPPLSYEEIMKNSETYQVQFFKILDKSKTEIVFNGDWFKKMNFVEIMQLASKFTVARLLERDDFTKRLEKQTPISIHELFYPLMQGYDSVAIKADVEIGATEQKFNLLAGRTIQEAYGVKPQVILTMPILVGLDGQKKMSKSLNNYIGIDESPGEIFGKVMSIADEQIYSYFELATDVTLEELKRIKQKLNKPDVNPMVIKKELGQRLVDMYHPAGSGQSAREEFERVFSKKQLPQDMPELTLEELKRLGLKEDKVYLVHLMSKTKMVKSNNEARKLILAGAVTIDGEKIDNPDFEFSVDKEMVLKVGKRRYLKLLV
ncbi:MAG: tyrosine--tRNA ligase [candidate division Zixibacteria bacterium]|nr:tyrosine--tRNA ligase [candidate division Zixibacteria bacterium]